MVYKLIARDRVFCEGTLSECQKCLTGISQMISAGFSTDFQVEEFEVSSFRFQVSSDADDKPRGGATFKLNT